MWNLILGFFYLFLSAILFTMVIWMLRWITASIRAELYIRNNNITSGIFVKHGMTFDTETGLVKPSSSPSKHAIERFL